MAELFVSITLNPELTDKVEVTEVDVEEDEAEDAVEDEEDSVETVEDEVDPEVDSLTVVEEEEVEDEAVEVEDVVEETLDGVLVPTLAPVPPHLQLVSTSSLSSFRRFTLLTSFFPFSINRQEDQFRLD